MTNKSELLNKFTFQPKVVEAFAFLDFVKDGITQRLIHSLKYQNNPDLGVWLGDKFGMKLKELMTHRPDIVLPSPLHPKKLKQRGYNQSEKIAEGLCGQLDIEISRTDITKIVETTSQTRKSKVNRWENVNEVFISPNMEAFQNKRVLIVDDVITSGATLGVLCDEVAKHDPSEIIVAAVAAAK